MPEGAVPRGKLRSFSYGCCRYKAEGMLGFAKTIAMTITQNTKNPTGHIIRLAGRKDSAMIAHAFLLTLSMRPSLPKCRRSAPRNPVAAFVIPRCSGTWYQNQSLVVWAIANAVPPVHSMECSYARRGLSSYVLCTAIRIRRGKRE